MKTLRLSAIILSLFALATSCKKEFDIDPHGSGFHYVGPLAKSELAIDKFNDIQSFSFGKDFSAAEIGMQTGTLPFLPSFSNLKAGPDSFQLNSFVQSVTVDTCNIQFSIQNNFPISLKQGLMLIVQNTSDNSIIYQFTMMSDLAPGQSMTVVDKIINQKIECTVNASVLNISSDGLTNPVTIDATNSLSININLQILGLNEIVLKPSRTLLLQDTTDFNQNFSNPFDKNGGGIMKLFSTSKIADGLRIQFYFLDQNHVLLDSLFENTSVPAAIADVSGNILSTSDTVLLIQVNEARVNMLNNAKYVHSKIICLPSNSPVYLRKENIIDLQLTADIEL